VGTSSDMAGNAEVPLAEAGGNCQGDCLTADWGDGQCRARTGGLARFVVSLPKVTQRLHSVK